MNGPRPAQSPRLAQAWAVLQTVLDPEVPVVSVCELGIVRDVLLQGDGLQVVLTPTYSGCPATELIESNVVAALVAAGLGPVSVTLQRAPAWTTDWISAEGRAKLRDYGIAPPGPALPDDAVVMQFMPRRKAPALNCPRCGSSNTERISAFGSTACKALYRCLACKEPFEHFKPL
ncbi:MAG: 1,2-phenylacetyl-CoA epoxidase subunit PaaD [Burkholderiaceae bacterium]|nr:1,2-phenylacetyl-CoA epoxidase subunit PaaD [Burkholderiaceae bacterium]